MYALLLLWEATEDGRSSCVPTTYVEKLKALKKNESGRTSGVNFFTVLKTPDAAINQAFVLALVVIQA